MITYENEIHTAIDKIASLLSTEMTGIPLSFDEHRGNQSLLIVPDGDSVVEIMSNGQVREYTILISYELATTGHYSENNFKQISNVVEHIKRLFAPDNNSSVTDYFFDAVVQSVDYGREESVNRATITLTCKRLEV